ncbi:hypothetical protein SteCoe_28222 [Stentor coeruleus]|uniref:Uncharacterized protein n=1 Tax=Stentor coeruleus TaxID=5963 RepID=A0A1R2B8Q3_9CILI|nr:hypothetical protein SteCoe_28222 [Stentor coeruleus]
MEPENSYMNVCRAKGVSPLQDVVQVLANKESLLQIKESTKLSESEIFCLSSILEENFSFLTSFSITNQNLTLASVNILSQGFKANHVITKLVLNKIQFADLAYFYKISEALTLNEALMYIDLSQNGLDNSTADLLLELLGVLPNLKYLNLEKNRLQSLQWGYILAVNTSLEHLNLNFNTLSYKTIENLLDSLKINKTLKILNLLGCEKSSDFYNSIGPLLARVLQNSSLTSLTIEIDENCEYLDDLAKTLTDSNTDLINFSAGEQWKTATKPLQIIWRAIQANNWIFSKLKNPNAECEISADFQEILEHKLNKLKDQEAEPDIKIEESIEIHTEHLDIPIYKTQSSTSKIMPETPQFSGYASGKQFKLDQDIESLDKAEDELIAQVYVSHKEEMIEEKSLFSTSIFNESPRNFIYSESSNVGESNADSSRDDIEKVTKKIKKLQKQIRNVDEHFVQTAENIRVDMKKEMNLLVENIKEIQEQGEKTRKKVERVVEAGKESEVKAGLKEKVIEKFIASFETRLAKLEKSDESRQEGFENTKNDMEELRNNYKELVARVEKYELNTKLQVNSIKKSICNKQEITNVQDKQASVNAELQTLSLTVSQIDSQVEKLKQLTLNLQKNEKTLQKKREELDISLSELKQKMGQVEAKYEDLPDFDKLTSLMQKDIDNKISRIELKVWDNLEIDPKKDFGNSSLRTFDRKLHFIDEKVNKIFESFKELAKDMMRIDSYKIPENFERLEKVISQTAQKKYVIPQMEKRVLKSAETYENLRSPRLKNSYSGNRPSIGIRPPSVSLSITKHEDLGKSFPDKIGENENFTVRNLKEDHDTEDLSEKGERAETRKIGVGEGLPVEAESVILNAIIEKTNKNRVPQLRKFYSEVNLSPTSTADAFRNQFAKFEDAGPSLELQESLKLRGINI